IGYVGPKCLTVSNFRFFAAPSTDSRPPGGCHTDEFQCLMDGLCIPLRWRCDGDTDCMDMSDEKECEGVTHMCDPAVKFGCKDSGEEIRKCVRCGEVVDCEDNSDEENCEALVCKLSHHVCANDSTICLPAEKLCDGTDDCPDGSDEKLCGEKQQFPHCASEQGSHNGKDNNLNHSLLFPISQTSAPWTTVAAAITALWRLARAPDNVLEHAPVCHCGSMQGLSQTHPSDPVGVDHHYLGGPMKYPPKERMMVGWTYCRLGNQQAGEECNVLTCHDEQPGPRPLHLKPEPDPHDRDLSSAVLVLCGPLLGY
uniref:Uncharacterized protein n=1 Tax=Oryzias latipes TaxID=8090 RepID=A0A3P9JAK6_ORYLA